MASRDVVSDLFKNRLKMDSHTQMKKAIGLWHTLAFRFFYLGDATNAELALDSTLDDICTNLGIGSPTTDHLKNVIGLQTVVDTAITSVFLESPPSI